MKIDSIYQMVLPLFRRKRMRNFMKTFTAHAGTRILDVGGTPLNWTLIHCRPQVTLLNLLPPEKVQTLPDNFSFVIGDGTALQYPDGEFDICYSNSVIEHLGTRERQMKFANEIRRVARQVWVQTPSRSFFFEPHLLTPFIHFLPKEVQRKLLRNFTVWGWFVRPGSDRVEKFLNEVRLLAYDDMRRLFPDCEIRKEKFLGITKAFIAVRT